MRPHFSLRAILLLPCLLVVLLLWLDAPKRNATRLLQTMNVGNYDEANRILAGAATISRLENGRVRLELPDGTLVHESKSDTYFKRNYDRDEVYWVDRTLLDIVSCRAHFVAGSPYCVWKSQGNHFAIEIRP